jgi:hypothetical protein
MATENNKNISYSNHKDLFKREKIVLNNVIKSSLLSKITTLTNAIKQKHS